MFVWYVALSEIVITGCFYKKWPSALYLFNLVKNITNNIVMSEVLKTMKKENVYSKTNPLYTIHITRHF